MHYSKHAIASVVSSSIEPDKASIFELSPEAVKTIQSLTGIILAVIATAGVLTLAAVAPNIFVAGRKVFSTYKHLSNKDKSRKIAKSFYYLKKSGLIKMTPTAEDFKIMLTEKAKQKLKKLFFNAVSVPKPKRWNGRWWQIAADIPTKDHRNGADLLRRKLKEMNFYPLQRTLWFYPFDPRDQVQTIATEYDVANYVTMMEISRLDKEDASNMKNHFKAIGIL